MEGRNCVFGKGGSDKGWMFRREKAAYLRCLVKRMKGVKTEPCGWEGEAGGLGKPGERWSGTLQAKGRGVLRE